MPTTIFTIRMDKTTKEEFDKLVNSFGMTASTAFNIFARQVVREKRIPFEIGEPKKDESLSMLLEEISQSAKQSRTDNLTLDDINKEISDYRKEKAK